METKKDLIRQSVLINAPKEKVWDVLFTDPYIRLWYAEFGEGSHAKTDWKVGSKAIFTDNSKSGLVAEVIVNQPNEKLSVEYTGVVTNGEEDYESELAKEVKGGRETYHISERDGGTYLEIECNMAPEYYEEMSAAWVKALQKVKNLAEGK
ncbi:SRPBCC family protein [Dyadobacter diqingensis]|uniref:SRPBCC family protein n=1 Tax=Dyadobacter diqingensis TaxID=2938121 RepID=UPI0020C196B2|nr:SRPBCC domain-containing protein [Dyadobacter diqingensis]